MFRGATLLTIDVKGRIAMPSRYRELLDEACQGHLVITVDRDHCLLLYPLPQWEEIEHKLVQLPTLNPHARRLQRLLMGHATECELDSAGRFLLPPVLREFATIEKHCMLIGQGNKFELWDERRWTERRNEWLAQEDGLSGSLPAELESLSF